MRGMQWVGAREKPTFSTVASAEMSASFFYDRISESSFDFSVKSLAKLPKLTAAISSSESHLWSLKNMYV